MLGVGVAASTTSRASIHAHIVVMEMYIWNGFLKDWLVVDPIDPTRLPPNART